jgi:peptidoglycan/LPS O-acetylase OafA/YrhL
MRKERMTEKKEIQELTKEKRKAYRIGVLFFAVLAVTTLAFQYRDLLTGTGSDTTRPPVYQLIAGLVAAVAVGYLSYRFFASDFTKDISTAEKKYVNAKSFRSTPKRKKGI